MNIITLSTIPPRFGMIDQTLESLTQQTADIDRVILYIPRTYRRFPDYDGTLPHVPSGVEVVVVDEDLGPASKVLPAVQAYQGQDVNILFCDDDRLYLENWAQTLINEAQKQPENIICMRGVHMETIGVPPCQNKDQPRAVHTSRKFNAHYRFNRIMQQIDVFSLFTPRHKPPRMDYKTSGFADILEGTGGVLVKPHFFDQKVFDIPDALWAVDDVWLSGHAARAGVKIWGVGGVRTSAELPVLHHAALHNAVIDGLNRQEANRACVKYFRDTYGIWK